MDLKEQGISVLDGANTTNSPEKAMPQFIKQMENGRQVTYEQLDMFNSPPRGRLDIRFSLSGHIGGRQTKRACR